MDLGGDPPVSAEHLVRSKCRTGQERVGEPIVRAVLPLDRNPVLEQLLQVEPVRHIARRLLTPAAIHTATGEPLEVLHETSH